MYMYRRIACVQVVEKTTSSSVRRVGDLSLKVEHPYLYLVARARERVGGRG